VLFLRVPAAARLPPESYERSPCGDCFVKSSVAKGVLPEILQELLAARKRCALKTHFHMFCAVEQPSFCLTVTPIYPSSGVLAIQTIEFPVPKLSFL
jgi:hypothetical protein